MMQRSTSSRLRQEGGEQPHRRMLLPLDRQGLLESVAGSLPIGRVGQADDLADAALSLMGNGFINGTVLHVDGGGRIA